MCRQQQRLFSNGVLEKFKYSQFLQIKAWSRTVRLCHTWPRQPIKSKREGGFTTLPLPLRSDASRCDTSEKYNMTHMSFPFFQYVVKPKTFLSYYFFFLPNAIVQQWLELDVSLNPFFPPSIIFGCTGCVHNPASQAHQLFGLTGFAKAFFFFKKPGLCRCLSVWSACKQTLMSKSSSPLTPEEHTQHGLFTSCRHTCK